MNAGSNPHGLSTDMVNLLHRMQQEDVRRTFRLVGQQSGLSDLPDEEDELPFEGLMRDIKRWANRFLDQLVIALVLLALFGISLSPGIRP